MIYLNDVKIIPTRFPDGTSQVWKLLKDNIKEVNYIKWIFENESEIIILAQLKTLLNGTEIHLSIPYLPYARQDKHIDNNNCFALHTFAQIINNLNFNSIECLDPHSDIASTLIYNLNEKYVICKKFIEEHKIDLILFPDLNAAKKYSKMYSFKPFIHAEKVRDQSSGHINSYEIIGDCNGNNVLIIDDICDGGGTFILAAESLYKKGANEVSLFVTHGIFSKGQDILKKSGIKNISCVFDFNKRELL